MSSVRTRLETWADREGVQFHGFSQIDSTNTFAKSLPWGAGNCVVVADHQTFGRGRGTHTWLDSDDGRQLLSSWVFTLSHPPQPIATARLGLALWRASVHTWPQADWSLKAPNDLMLNGQKVAGLLLEAISQGDSYRLIIGLGFNLAGHPTDLPQASDVVSSEPNAVEQFDNFLKTWWLELHAAIADLEQAELSATVCENLLKALNKNPNLATFYTQVHPDGSLQTPNGKIDWLSL